jgi:RNA recognition motif-containing protein
LRSKTTKETVYQVLSAFGPVRYLRMPFNNSLKKNLGYGFVIYSENSTGRYLLREVRKLSVDGKEVLLLDYMTNSHERKARWNQSNSPKLSADELAKQTVGVLRSDFLPDKPVTRLEPAKQLSYSFDAVRNQVAVALDTQLALERHRPTSSRYYSMGRRLDSSFSPHNLKFRVETRIQPR